MIDGGGNTVNDSDGLDSQSASSSTSPAVTTATDINRRRERASKVFKGSVAAAGAVVVTGLIVGSVASWTDSGTIFSEFSSAEFEVEYATGERDVDGELIWFTRDGNADLLFEIQLGFDGEEFSVGDVQSDEFYVRVTDDDDADNDNSPDEHAAVLWLDDIAGTGDVEGFAYEFVVDNAEDDAQARTVASGASLNTIDESDVVGLEANEVVAVNIDVVGTDDLSENAQASVEWTVSLQETAAYEAGVEPEEVNENSEGEGNS